MQWVDINYLHLDFDYVLLQKSDENSIPHNRLYSPDQSHLKTDDAGATSVEGCSNLVDDSCHGSTGSPSALLGRVLRGGVTVLEGQGF